MVVTIVCRDTINCKAFTCRLYPATGPWTVNVMDFCICRLFYIIVHVHSILVHIVPKRVTIGIWVLIAKNPLWNLKNQTRL